AAEKEVKAQLDKLPDLDSINDPKMKKEAENARFAVENELKQTQYERGLNLYDQATALFVRGEDAKSSELLVEAKKILDPLASGDARHPSTWRARAWLGRIINETETADKARARFQEVLNESPTGPAAEGIRLARYFRLLVISKSPSDADKKA